MSLSSCNGCPSLYAGTVHARQHFTASTIIMDPIRIRDQREVSQHATTEPEFFLAYNRVTAAEDSRRNRLKISVAATL